MSDHLTQNQIEGYGRHLLPALELLTVTDHLAVCETCRRQTARMLNSDAAYLALKSKVFSEAEPAFEPTGRSHLTFEQIAGLVDGDLAGEERQMVKDHLTCCEQCDLAVNDLRAFKDQISHELDRDGQLAPLGMKTESRWRRLTETLSSFWPKSPALAFGSAFATILLVATGWVMWRSLQKTNPAPEIAQTVQPNSSTQALPETAMIIARLNDGEGQVTLDREGRLSGIDNLSTSHQQMVRRALAGQELEKSPHLAGLTQQWSRPRGNGDGSDHRFSVVEPVGSVIFSDRPTFRWSQLDGASNYVVEVYDENLDLAATSSQLSSPTWTPPQSLKRGETYYWQVKGLKDGQEIIAPRLPAPQAKFRILDQAKANELVQARRSYASSHLTMGLLYAQAGLLNEAEREFRALQKANPDSTIASQLLKQVQSASK